MNKNKIQHTYNFSPDTGISYFTLYTPEGTFTGLARCHDDDFELISNYFGFELAELRAWIKYSRHLRTLCRTQLKVCNQLLNSIPNKTKAWYKIKDKYNSIQQDIDDLTDAIADYNDQITGLCKQREDFLKFYQRTKQDKTN